MNVAILSGVIIGVLLSGASLYMHVTQRRIGQPALPIRASRTPGDTDSVGVRLRVWTFACLLAGVLPVGLDLVLRAILGGGWQYKHVLSAGELVLISVVLSLAALGDFGLRSLGKTFNRQKLNYLIGAGLHLLCASLLYGAVKATTATGRELASADFLASASALLFLLGTGLCVRSIIVSSDERIA